MRRNLVSQCFGFSAGRTTAHPLARTRTLRCRGSSPATSTFPSKKPVWIDIKDSESFIASLNHNEKNKESLFERCLGDGGTQSKTVLIYDPDTIDSEVKSVCDSKRWECVSKTEACQTGEEHGHAYTRASAIKIIKKQYLLNDSKAMQAVIDEVSVMKMRDHPNLIQLVEFGEDGKVVGPQTTEGLTYIVMEYAWSWGWAFNALIISMGLKVIDLLCNVAVPTPKVTRDRKEQEIYETIVYVDPEEEECTDEEAN